MSLEVRYLSTSERARRLVEEGLKLLEMSSLEGELIVTSSLEYFRERMFEQMRAKGHSETVADVVSRVSAERARSREYVLYLQDGHVLLLVGEEASICDVLHALGHVYVYLRYRHVVTGEAIMMRVSRRLSARERLDLEVYTILTAKTLVNALEDALIDLWLSTRLGDYAYCIEQDLTALENYYEKYLEEVARYVNGIEIIYPELISMPVALTFAGLKATAIRLQTLYHRHILGKTSLPTISEAIRIIAGASDSWELHKALTLIWTRLGEPILKTEYEALNIEPPEILLEFKKNKDTKTSTTHVQIIINTQIE